MSSRQSSKVEYIGDNLINIQNDRSAKKNDFSC
jgi:hypothetical protein